MKHKAFIFSDTHGLHPSIIKDELELVGFDKRNPKHHLYLAGDITDGLNNERELIDWLMDLEKEGKLTAIMGNHDYWTINTKRPQRRLGIANKRMEWLKSLPYQFENKYLKMAHGMWFNDNELISSKNKNRKPSEYRKASVMGCPVLLGTDKWNWALPWNIVTSINNSYKDLKEYSKQFKDKPLILGHFWQQALFKHKPELKEYINKQDGFINYNNIHWVDSDVLNGGESSFGMTNAWNKGYKEIRIKVMEF